MTNAVQEVWLPWPPSVNNLFSQGIVKGKVRRFPSKQYKAWRKAASGYLLAARLRPYAEPVVIHVALTPGDSRPRDADNYNKPIIDALVEMGVIPGDDSRHVKAVLAHWENPNTKHAGAVVTLRPANMEGKERPLNAAARQALARWERQPLQLVKPSHKRSAMTRALVVAGYIEELPGLIPDAPQGYRLRETDRS